MDTIRKKMSGMKARLAQAEAEAADAEKELAEINAKADAVSGNYALAIYIFDYFLPVSYSF